mmetsp:Transcript_4677/g.10138  ORF Transcript_4677/g.10138 Transcript_4677/m.10138 type:complete len:176 (-) Transcript_4677:426-953(-)
MQMSGLALLPFTSHLRGSVYLLAGANTAWRANQPPSISTSSVASEDSGPSTSSSSSTKIIGRPVAKRSGSQSNSAHVTKSYKVPVFLHGRRVQEEQDAGNIPLNKTSRAVLDKLVGCLTKKGQRSVAEGIVRDAMHIMQVELEKGAQPSQAQAATTSSSVAAAGKKGEKAASSKS